MPKNHKTTESPIPQQTYTHIYTKGSSCVQKAAPAYQQAQKIHAKIAGKQVERKKKPKNLLYVGVEMCPYVNIRLKSYPMSELRNRTKQENT